MGWLDIFASEKIQEKAVDFIDDTVKGVGGWVDDFNFTDEEMSEARQKMLAFRLSVLERTADESSIRSISRRVLAWSVTGVFLLIIVIAVIGFILKLSWAVNVLEVAKLIYSSFLAIISFYFVSNIIGSSIDKMKAKDE